MMMFGLRTFLLLCLLACFGQNALGSDIIKGKKSAKKSFKYMASLQWKGQHICGGFLVSEEFVLTAAHCESEKNPITSVVLGTHNLQDTKGKIERTVVKKCPHGSYKNDTMKNDIMLIKLSDKVKEGKQVEFIHPPPPEMNLSPKDKCHVAGWGATKTNGSSVNDLRDVDVSVVDPQVCKKEWQNKSLKIPPNVICAGGYLSKKGFCQGDSGGPLVCRKRAVGIVSFNNYCNYPDLPNVYTDVSKFLPWIKKTLQKKDCIE